VTQPERFFATTARRVPLWAALITALVAVWASTLLGGLLLRAGVDGVQGTAAAILHLSGILLGDELVGTDLTPTGLLGGLVLAPLLGALLVALVTLLAHCLVIIVVGDGNAGLRATLRVVAYTFVVSLVNWLPLVGLPLNALGALLAGFGLREVHQTTTRRAAVVAVLPVACMVLFFVLVRVLPE
jgi:hypothetical protein